MTEYPMISKKEVIDFFYSFLAFLKKCILFTILSIRQNLLLYALLVSIIGLGGFFYLKNKPVYYESTMVCSYNNLHKKTYGEMVNRLDQLATSQSYSQLSKLLCLSEKEAKCIVGIDDKNIAGSPLHEDITPDQLPMYFTLKATNLKVFDTVEKGLLVYLNSSPRQQLRQTIEQEKLRKRIVFYEETIQKIDSIIHLLCNNKKLLLSDIDSSEKWSGIRTLFQNKEDLEAKKIDDLKAIQLTHSVELIYGFAPSEKLVGNGKNNIFKIIILAVFIPVFIVTLKKLLTDGS